MRLVEATDQSTICFKAVWSFIFHIPLHSPKIWDDNPKKTPNCQGGVKGSSPTFSKKSKLDVFSFSDRSLSVSRFAGNPGEKGCQWQRALQLHGQMRRRNVVSFSSCISALEKGRQWQKAETFLESMLQEQGSQGSWGAGELGSWGAGYE